jgi:hypothetical protein
LAFLVVVIWLRSQFQNLRNVPKLSLSWPRSMVAHELLLAIFRFIASASTKIEKYQMSEIYECMEIHANVQFFAHL